MASLFDLQEKNRRKTRIIVIGFLLFFLWLGLGLDLAIYFLKGSKQRSEYRYAPAPYSQRYAEPVRKPFYPVFTVLVGLVGIGVAWWSMANAAETVLRAVMAEPANRDNSQAERTLINIVEEMSIASGLATPQVWIIPDDDPNALATGLRDGDFHVAVTRGLLRTLNRDELQGVVAHEFAHLKNDDTRLMTSLTVLVGMAALISEFVARVRLRIGSDDSDSSDTKIGMAIYVLWLVTALLAPVVTQLMTLMVSREREYLADASAAQYTRNPEALAQALEKIAYADAPTQMVRPASAQLCIASPTAADLEEDESWFATHPPIRKRVARLRSMGQASTFQDTQPLQVVR